MSDIFRTAGEARKSVC